MELYGLIHTNHSKSALHGQGYMQQDIRHSNSRLTTLAEGQNKFEVYDRTEQGGVHTDNNHDLLCNERELRNLSSATGW